ncbi:MAG: hypothetical protein WA634_11430 [Silvibacterium sp.]
MHAEDDVNVLLISNAHEVNLAAKSRVGVDVLPSVNTPRTVSKVVGRLSLREMEEVDHGAELKLGIPPKCRHQT